MKKYLFIILLSLYSANSFAGPSGYIGSHDNRRYGSLSDPEYIGVARLTRDENSLCTGVFISKNLILTNSHCAVGCLKGCNAEFSDGISYKTSGVKPVFYSSNSGLLTGNDWALLLSDQNSKFYKQISPNTSPGHILRGGYGMLRVIGNDEIPFLKKLYYQTKEEFKEECSNKFKDATEFLGCINEHLDDKLKQMGKVPLFEDQNNFKVQECNILGNHSRSNKIVVTDCDSSGGDSGAPFLRNNQIVGLNNGGKQTLFGANETGAYGLKTETFYWPIQTYLSKYTGYPVINRSNTYETVNMWDSDGTAADSATAPTFETTDDKGIEKFIEQKLQDFDCD